MKKLKKNKDKKVKDSAKTNTIKFNIIAIVCIVIFCIAICPITLQNDTFYTIRIGEHIINTKTIDMQDQFSWHENLPYTYPHWAYDVMIYFIYHLFGMMGIYISTIVFTCILGILIYFTNCKISKNRVVSFFITIGAIYLLGSYVTARAQLVTFILLELAILFIEKFLESKKIGYAIGLICIPIAIANLHCAVWPFFFVIFLPYIAEYLIFTIIDSNFIYKIQLKLLDIKIKEYNKKLTKDISEDKKMYTIKNQYSNNKERENRKKNKISYRKQRKKKRKPL